MATTDPRRETNGRPARAAVQSLLPGLPTAAPARARPRDARELFVGSPRTVLARLACGDPLELGARVARRLRERALLMDAERVQLAALVRCAREGSAGRGAAGFETWLTSCVDAAIDEGLAAPEGELEPAAPGPWDDLARPLGLEPRAMARAAARFNALPREVREAFAQLVLAGRDLDAWAATTGRSAVALARDARRALDLFLDAAASPPAPPRRPS